MSEVHSVPVFYQAEVIGNIRLQRDETIQFQYKDDWLTAPNNFPLSLSLPLSDSTYGAEKILTWAANLMPEESQLAAITRILGLSSGDVLSILEEIGGDTAGAISFGQPSHPDAWSYRPLTSFYGVADEGKALAAHFQDLKERPFLVGEDGIRLSLAGGQSKSALALLNAAGQPKLGLPEEGDRLAIPMNGAPSTLIIKPENANLPGIVENELFCLRLADKIGIPAVKATSIASTGQTALCVARYDRTSKNSVIQRGHQEDFAQILNVLPSRKYENASRPGPSLSEILNIRRYLSPQDGLKLADQVVFNILVANTDAHAKNYSVCLPSAQATLAPLYDVSCVLTWKAQRINQFFAQKLAGKKRKPEDMAPRHWETIAQDAGLNAMQFRRRVLQIAKLIDSHSVSVVGDLMTLPGISYDHLQAVEREVSENARRIAGRFA